MLNYIHLNSEYILEINVVNLTEPKKETTLIQSEISECPKKIKVLPEVNDNLHFKS